MNLTKYGTPLIIIAALVLIVAPAIIQPEEYASQAIVSLLFLILIELKRE